MSRGRSYAYAAHTPPPPVQPCYYYDDMEGYVGDYSESDGLSDVPTHVVTATPPDVTEIYRRKTVTPTIPATVATPTAQVDYHTVYAPQEYYYEAGTTPQAAVPRRATVAYRKRIPIMGERARYYSPDSGELYDSMAFRSTHQILPSMARSLPPRVPSASAVRQASVRRHPITVRTPRFYRRPGGTTLYKKPSALCLPVACQPDPAVYKRSKRSSSDQIYTPEYVYQPQTAKVPFPTEKGKSAPQKVPQDTSHADYNDLNVTKSKLDAALQRYEQIFEKNSSDADRYPEAKIAAQILKPKVPHIVKSKHPEQEKHFHQEKSVGEKHKARNRNNQKIDWTKARVLEVEEAESDALEKILLADLKANGMVESDDLRERKCQKKSPSPARSEKKTEKVTKTVEANAQANEISLKDLPKSFNYQDIQNVVVKTIQHQQNQQTQQQAEMKQFHAVQPDNIANNLPSSKKCSRTNLIQEQSTPMSDSTYSRPASPPASSQVSSKRQASNENLDKASECKSVRAGVVPRVLVDDAMELHRTKSYVVNLIDHALSNHFGTNLCEKYSTKDNPIDPKVAMELLKKHSACKVNKDVCLEIAQALADTFNNSTTSCSTMTQVDAKPETSACSCNKSEEPLYVKQLKQLRWGHLKHIQREVRRLEDLERFLDSCTSNTFS